MSTETLDGLMSVRDLRHNLHVRLAVDDRNDPLADKRRSSTLKTRMRLFPAPPALEVLLWQISLGSMDYGYL
jgi:hypothetical protein